MNLLLSSPALTVQEQMALDEEIVRVRPNELTLRFYQWAAGPAVTFGYAQFIREVRQALELRHFIGAYTRRPTGGGIVFHEGDLTFSLVFPSKDRPTEIYKRLHGFIQAELARGGARGNLFDRNLPASAYAPSINHAASACFQNPVENDLLAEDGQKMLGGALRRFGGTVLYQGSLQTPGARENPLYKKAIISAVRACFAADLAPRCVDEAVLARSKALAQTQYACCAWTEKF